MGVRFGLTQGQAKAYADQVLQIPKTATTTVTANTGPATQSIASLEARLYELTKPRTVTITQMIQSRTLPGLPGPGQNSDPTLGGLLPTKKAAGGYITGPGTSTSDSIPAMLSAGEYVLQASAVSRVGTAFLDQLNSTRYPRGYANGGLVGEISQMRFGDQSWVRGVMSQALAAAVAGRSGSSGPVVHVNGPITTTDTARAIAGAIETRFSDALAVVGR